MGRRKTRPAWKCESFFDATRRFVPICYVFIDHASYTANKGTALHTLGSTMNSRLVPKVGVIYGACYGVFFREHAAKKWKEMCWLVDIRK